MLQRLYKRRLGEWGEVTLLISIGGVRGCKLNCVKACREFTLSTLYNEDMCTEPYFSHYPFFGLPTEVEDCDIIYHE